MSNELQRYLDMRRLQAAEVPGGDCQLCHEPEGPVLRIVGASERLDICEACLVANDN